MAVVSQLALAVLLLAPLAAAASVETPQRGEECSAGGAGCDAGLLQQWQQPPSMRAAVASGDGGSCEDPSFKSCARLERIQVMTEAPLPTLGPGQALVQVEASSVNPSDWKFLFLAKGTIGRDFAGKVVALAQPCQVNVGDLVWGDAIANGAFAEYLAIDCSKIAVRPQGFTAAEAGALPHVGLSSLQAFVMAGAPWQTGPKVLVLGGSGGTGHVGVQLARALGASHVATTCSAARAEALRQLGADQVIDYHTQNWWEVLTGVDVIFDTVGEDFTGEHAYGILKPGGFLVTLVNGPRVLASKSTAEKRPRVRQAFSALRDYSQKSLGALKNMAERGKLKVIVSKTYDLNHVRDALEESKAGHAYGKISVSVA